MYLFLYKAVSLHYSATLKMTNFGSSRIDVYYLIRIYRLKVYVMVMFSQLLCNRKQKLLSNVEVSVFAR